MIETITSREYYCTKCKKELKPTKVVYTEDGVKHGYKCGGDVEETITSEDRIN